MMSRWGLEGMRSFEQMSVARKEKTGTEHHDVPLHKPDVTITEGSTPLS